MTYVDEYICMRVLLYYETMAIVFSKRSTDVFERKNRRNIPLEKI